MTAVNASAVALSTESSKSPVELPKAESILAAGILLRARLSGHSPCDMVKESLVRFLPGRRYHWKHMGNRNTTAQRVWYGAAGLGGLVFGLIGERRPFGGDLLAHPLFVYVFAMAIGLLALRIVSRRPVPEII